MTDIPNTHTAPPEGDGALIKDGTTATFVEDVINASNEVPVIVDMWATWCEPCRTLSPIIEKVVNAANGAVKLVKIDVDQNPELAQQLRVQSIPSVYAFKNGQPVDGFVGALPESQVRDFVTALSGEAGPTPAEELLAEAEAAHKDGDLAGAAGLFGQVLKAEPGNAKALGGLAECYIESGEVALAKQTLALVPPEAANDPAILSAQAALSLKEAEGEAEDVTPLEAALAADENDHQSRYDLAMALIADERRAEAVDELLEIVRRSRTWNDDAARKQLLTLFDAFGAQDEITRSGRRRLSSILFS